MSRKPKGRNYRGPLRRCDVHTHSSSGAHEGQTPQPGPCPSTKMRQVAVLYANSLSRLRLRVVRVIFASRNIALGGFFFIHVETF